jgi:hypothetical protein
MKPIASDIIMDGDIIIDNNLLYKVEISSAKYNYMYINDKQVNVTTGYKGFLRSLDTGCEHRSEWKSLRVVERANPTLFSDCGKYLKYMDIR